MWCPVPRWNLRHRGANRCKRRSGLRQKCYRHRTARSAQTLDLPDEGRSIPTHPISTVNDLRRWLDDVLDGLGLTGSIAMAGQSCGCYATAEYVLHAPLRVGKLVWIAPVMIGAPLGKEFVERLRTIQQAMREAR
jgi:pimeloyl-ACP methyl ester carboxylesterase